MSSDPHHRRRRLTLWVGLALFVMIAAFQFRDRDAISSAASREIPLESAHRQDGLLFALGESRPFSGLLVESHPNGSRKLEIGVWNGRLEGPSRGWFSDGTPEVQETFHNDLSDGLRTRWHPNGAKRSEATIRQGILDGPFTEWHANGVKAVSMQMKDGKADGLVEAWHPSGTLKSRSTLRGGEIVERHFFEDPSHP